MLKEIFTLIFYGKRINYFYKILRVLNKTIFKIDYEYNLLKNVDCYYYKKVEDISFDTKIIIATAWQTAYFVNSFVNNHPKIEGSYLVQKMKMILHLAATILIWLKRRIILL